MSSKPTLEKAVLTITYVDYIVDYNQAVEIFKLFKGVERLKTEWDDKLQKSITYIQSLDVNQDSIKLTTIGQEKYALAKVLGKAKEQEKLNDGGSTA